MFVHSSIQRIHLIEANKTPKLRNLVSPIHSFFDEWSYPFIAKTQENIWHCPLACWTNKCITYPTFFFLSKLQCHSCIQKKKKSLRGLFAHSSIQRQYLIEANKTPKLRTLLSPIHSIYDEWSYPFIAKTQANIWHCTLACWANV